MNLQRIPYCIARSLSIMLYPLLIPTYGILLLWLHMSRHAIHMIPSTYWWVMLGMTIWLTLLIPICLFLILKHRHVIASFDMEKASERTEPYIYTTLCFGAWTYALYSIMQAPSYLWLTTAGATIALLGVMLINRRWKISAHLTAMGGLTGGMCSMCLYYHTWMLWPVIIVLLVSLLLMYARLYLDAHTPTQVVAGYGLGLVLTSIPYLIYA